MKDINSMIYFPGDIEYFDDDAFSHYDSPIELPDYEIVDEKGNYAYKSEFMSIATANALTKLSGLVPEIAEEVEKAVEAIKKDKMGELCFVEPIIKKATELVKGLRLVPIMAE